MNVPISVNRIGEDYVEIKIDTCVIKLRIPKEDQVEQAQNVVALSEEAANMQQVELLRRAR